MVLWSNLQNRWKKENKFDDLDYFVQEIIRFKESNTREAMLAGERYYRGEQDILWRKRTVIGPDGTLQEVKNLPHNRIVDNQYAKMVDQKVNYLLGKPLSFDISGSDHENYSLKSFFNRKFFRLLKNVAEDVLNGGIGWLHPYVSEKGELLFRRFPPYEILPFWEDAEHTRLAMCLRIYESGAGLHGKAETVEKVEVYKAGGIERYIFDGSRLRPDAFPYSPYLLKGADVECTWGKVPMIGFKYNNKEIPLISRVKSLQDGINLMLSDFSNHMQEDIRNTILVLKNYDGEDLNTFRHNLSTYGVVKVKTVDGCDGGVETLAVQVDAGNYKAVLDLFKKALIENARGFDAKDDRLLGSPNQMNIQSMYADIDLDANGMETEFQASLEEVLYFMNTYLEYLNLETVPPGNVSIIFNRDVLVNESESIENCMKSLGILSHATVVHQHPWVLDGAKELQRLAEEKM